MNKQKFIDDVCELCDTHNSRVKNFASTLYDTAKIHDCGAYTLLYNYMRNTIILPTYLLPEEKKNLQKSMATKSYVKASPISIFY